MLGFLQPVMRGRFRHAADLRAAVNTPCIKPHDQRPHRGPFEPQPPRL
jgi:hypothetical protein